MLNIKKATKKKANINLIGFLLISIGLFIIIFRFCYSCLSLKLEEESIDAYIKKYENVDSYINKNNNKKNQQFFVKDYIAILEIPKINLKKGLIMATKDFKSINYAVSIDRNSKFPNESGNFILYAHAGNSKISYFKDINKLVIGDIVNVYYLNDNYRYIVSNKYEIKKTGYLSLNEDCSNNCLILITCVHNTNKQLVIKCTLEKIY